MTEIKKFKRGNVVRVIDGFWDEKDSYTGRLAVIEGSYTDLYGGSRKLEDDDYSIIFKDNGNSSAWWKYNKLEFVSEGGEYEIEECREIFKRIKERNSDINYIKETLLNDGPLAVNTTSILTLFREVKVPSSFNRTGEFFMLFHEWLRIYPMFEAIFKYD